MIRLPINDGWSFVPKTSAFEQLTPLRETEDVNRIILASDGGWSVQ
jgi:hypothetical protein